MWEWKAKRTDRHRFFFFFRLPSLCTSHPEPWLPTQNTLAHHYHSQPSTGPRTCTHLKPSCMWPIQRLLINHAGLQSCKSGRGVLLEHALHVVPVVLPGCARPTRRIHPLAVICLLHHIYQEVVWPCQEAKVRGAPGELRTFIDCVWSQWSNDPTIQPLPAVAPPEAAAAAGNIIELDVGSTCTQVWLSLHSRWICTVHTQTHTHTLSAFKQSAGVSAAHWLTDWSHWGETEMGRRRKGWKNRKVKRINAHSESKSQSLQRCR